MKSSPVRSGAPAYRPTPWRRPAQLIGGVLSSPRNLPLSGNTTGGGPFTVTCPANYVAVSIVGRYGHNTMWMEDVTTMIGVVCKDLASRRRRPSPSPDNPLSRRGVHLVPRGLHIGALSDGHFRVASIPTRSASPFNKSAANANCADDRAAALAAAARRPALGPSCRSRERSGPLAGRRSSSRLSGPRTPSRPRPESSV